MGNVSRTGDERAGSKSCDRACGWYCTVNAISDSGTSIIVVAALVRYGRTCIALCSKKLQSKGRQTCRDGSTPRLKTIHLIFVIVVSE